MALRSGPARTLAPLLVALIACHERPAPPPAPAQPPSFEQVWRQARADAETKDLRLVEGMIDEALSRAGNSDDRWVWALRVQRGDVIAQQRRLEEAKKILSQELPEPLRKSEIEVRRLMSLALTDYYSDAKSRNAAMERAAAIASTCAPDVAREVAGLRPFLTGSVTDFDEAERRALQAGDQRAALKLRASHVTALARQRRFAEAIQLGEPLIPQLKAHGLRRSLRTMTGNLGWSYMEIGDYETAEELLTEADAEVKRMNAATEQLMWMNHLANLKFIRRDWTGAESSYRETFKRAKGHREYGHTLAYLGRVGAETGRYDDGLRSIAQAIAIAQQNENEEDVLNAQLVEAWLHDLAGRHDDAQSALLRILKKTRKAATRAEAQIRLAQLYVRAHDNVKAEEYFRRAIRDARQARKEVKDDNLRFAFFNTVDETFDDYVDFLVRAGRIGAALDVTETSRAQTLEEGLEVASSSRKADPRAIAKATGATILCYWLGRNRSYVWKVTPESVTIEPLAPDTEIEVEVDAYVKDLLGRKGTLSMSGARGERLYGMLVAPAMKDVLAPGARVVIVPDGRLHALNFETLVTGGHYWIEDVVLSSAGSLRLLERSEGRRSAAPTMLLVGNPLTANPAFPALARAGEEIDAIAGQFGDRCSKFDRARATPAAYWSAHPEKFDFLHFVAHGTAARKRPLESAVILGRDATGYQLLASDIMKRKLNARLVTISSCHGAGTRAYAGEGLVGLAWAFLRAGADQVIAALWEVNDSATPELMSTLYAGMGNGRDPAAALREAKLKLLHSGTIRSRPLYWAPFVLYSGS